jgi:hypothetical protein
MCNTASWVAAGGTIFLGLAAILGDWARSKIWKPKLSASIKMGPPDCVKTSWYVQNKAMGDVYYLRLWVENEGNAKARNVEVYAKELRRKRLDETWETLSEFPSMNLRWAYSHETYFPSISPHMGKHCDLAHVTNPSIRPLVDEERASLELSSEQTALALDLMYRPPDRVHIIGHGSYQLDILVAAENHTPILKTVQLNLTGTWYDNEGKMLKDGISAKIP